MSWIDLPEGELPCRIIVELVTDYLEDALDAATRDRFEEHLAECEPCVTFLEQMRTTVALVGEVPEADVRTLPDDVRQHLLDAFRHAGR